MSAIERMYAALQLTVSADIGEIMGAQIAAERAIQFADDCVKVKLVVLSYTDFAHAVSYKVFPSWADANAELKVQVHHATEGRLSFRRFRGGNAYIPEGDANAEKMQLLINVNHYVSTHLYNGKSQPASEEWPVFVCPNSADMTVELIERQEAQTIVTNVSTLCSDAFLNRVKCFYHVEEITALTTKLRR